MLPAFPQVLSERRCVNARIIRMMFLFSFFAYDWSFVRECDGGCE
jgi:hypothetical protein